ncbi:MAG: hypothetical protein H6621_02450 [Halobacteriovoraceae bacterium]|nr:hypothetical protein [Halobacteriovoraceae bacterium]MCB9093903.1 hypothetical protein [Halobacteriovoraceae bacterium]
MDNLEGGDKIPQRFKIYSFDQESLSNQEEFVDDPLEALLNEFGTENIENTYDRPLWESDETSLDNTIENEDIASIERDYFYQKYFFAEECSHETSDLNMNELENLIKRSKYLTQKLRYYNSYLISQS